MSYHVISLTLLVLVQEDVYSLVRLVDGHHRQQKISAKPVNVAACSTVNVPS